MSSSTVSTMRRLLMAALALTVAGCAATPQPEEQVRFEVRGLTTKSEESESFTAFTHEATVVVFGDSAASKQPYIVLLEIRRLSGGDPDDVRQAVDHIAITVIDGAGDFRMPAGYRNKTTTYQQAETWEPEKIELDVVAVTPMRSVR